MTDTWIGFLGGIVATLVAGLIASVAQRSNELRRRKAHLRVDAYYLLIDLKNWYFFVASAELRQKDPQPEVLENCRRIAFQLNDRIRAFDNLDDLEEVLTILFSEAIPTARERANRLDKLVEKFGKSVSPRYSAIISRISRENLLRHGPEKTPTMNAPGSWRFVK